MCCSAERRSPRGPILTSRNGWKARCLKVRRAGSMMRRSPGPSIYFRVPERASHWNAFFVFAAVRHTEKFGHIIMIKLQDGDATGKILPIYVGADSHTSPLCLVTMMRIQRTSRLLVLINFGHVCNGLRKAGGD